MSETVNSENRNNLNQYGYRFDNLRSVERKCSFCKEGGHVVTRCNNIAFLYFQELCILQKEYIQQTESLLSEAMTHFANWLNMYSLDNTSTIIRAFSVRKCGGRMSMPIHRCIELVTIYIFNLTTDINYNGLQTMGELVLNNLDTIRHMRQIFQSLLILQSIRENQNTKYNINIYECDKECDKEECDKECKEECSICYDTKLEREFVTLDCNHQFCVTCITNVFQKHSLENIDVPKCALCRGNITTFKCQKNQSENIKNDLSQFIEFN